MEKVCISLNSKINTQKTLNVQNMMIVDGRLRLHLIDDGAKNIKEGDLITVTRYFKDSNLKQITRNTTVVKKLDDSNIIVLQPNRLKPNRVVVNDSTFSDKWPIDITISFEDRLDLYNSDIASVKRHRTLNQVDVTFTNSSRPLEIVTKTNPIITDDYQNISLTVNLTKEEFEIVNNADTFMSISTNEFYDVDYNGYCHPWDEYDGDINITFSVNNMFYKIPVTVGNCVDHIGLTKELSLSTLYKEEYYDRLIPEIIDLEKVKFTPITIVNKNGVDNMQDCYSMHFIFHFRTREEGESSWHIDQRAQYAWNQEIVETNMKSKEIEIGQSDLLGCLGFEDSDVANSKMKLKESFIRLLFYSSTDMAEQKLLFYSTVFFDSTELHSKYIKLLSETGGGNGDLVHYDGCEYSDRLTSEITITSSADNTRSSEGFYLYLFKTDEFTPNSENAEKTIYMKVEFNHAKYGRTIPMLVWPIGSDGNGEYVSTENYFDCLYIPVKLIYNNGRYLYYFPEKVKNSSTGNSSNVIITLFEPRLVMQTERPEWKL